MEPLTPHYMETLKKQIREILERNTSTVYVGQDKFPVEVIHACNFNKIVNALAGSIKNEIEQRERKAQISESNWNWQLNHKCEM